MSLKIMPDHNKLHKVSTGSAGSVSVSMEHSHDLGAIRRCCSKATLPHHPKSLALAAGPTGVEQAGRSAGLSRERGDCLPATAAHPP